MTSISKQIRSRADFKLNTKVFYKKHTWRVEFFQPRWREASVEIIKNSWYRNRKIYDYLEYHELVSWKVRSDSSYFVYLTRPDRIPELLAQWGEDVIEIRGPINDRHQDIMLADLQVVTRKQLWYGQYRYKISSTQHGSTDQAVFQEMQEFCDESFEHGTYKINNVLKRSSKSAQQKLKQLQASYTTASGYQGNLFSAYRWMPYTATGSIYLTNHDDVVTLHMMFKPHITSSQKVVTFDELE